MLMAHVAASRAVSVPLEISGVLDPVEDALHHPAGASGHAAVVLAQSRRCGPEAPGQVGELFGLGGEGVPGEPPPASAPTRCQRFLVRSQNR